VSRAKESVDPVAGLKETLTHAKPSFRVVVMPDFYLDYILTYPGKLEDLTASFLEVAQRGGGNLLGWGHTVGRGGNASNVVAQLSKLGPEKLTQEDKQIISEADFVCVLNWNQNMKGTDLAEKVFSIAKEEGRAVTFFDPGDPASRIGEIEGLNERVLTPGLVDVLSVNENELVHLAKGVAEDTSEFEGAEDPLFGAASVFSMMIPRVDLHTPEFSATFVDGQRVRVPCAKIKPAKVTGAGDVWNAADIYAQGVGLGHKDRLIFANAAGAAYLEGRGLEPPTLGEVVGRVDSVVAARKP